MEASINAAMLRWVSPAQAVNDFRTFLKGILVEPAPQGGVFIAACDGKHMLIAHDATGFASERMVLNFSRKAAMACSKKQAPSIGNERAAFTAQIKDDRLVLLDQKGAEVFVQAGKATVDEGDKFPDLRKIVKLDDPAPPVAVLNPRYIANMTRELPVCKLNDDGCVKIFEDKSAGNGQALVQIMGYPLMGVIMSVRESDNRPVGWFLK